MSRFSSPPYLQQPTSVPRFMGEVLLALIPGIAIYCWLFGAAVLAQLLITTLTALIGEAVMLNMRAKPVQIFLSDGSAVVTAWLIALAFPPLAPWWLLVVGTLFAIVVAKHLYGGLGQNPFNPAMIAFAVCIVAFPAQMSQWPPLLSELARGDWSTFSTQLSWIFGQAPRVDAMTGATPLDSLKTALKLGAGQLNAATLLNESPVFGFIAGKGLEWVSVGFLFGGLYLWARRIISWHVSVAFLAGLGALASALYLFNPAQFANPLFHLFSGGTMLGAFFIVTDPVSGSTTPTGKLIFGFSAGILAYLIRVFGGYPDGVAFAVLLLNICVPLIDLYTQPAIFGMKNGGKRR